MTQVVDRTLKLEGDLTAEMVLRLVNICAMFFKVALVQLEWFQIYFFVT